jgi:hypothetical protein
MKSPLPRRTARPSASEELATFATGRSQEPERRPLARPAGHARSNRRRLSVVAVALIGTLLFTVVGSQPAGAEVPTHASRKAKSSHSSHSSDTGFIEPFSGPSAYEYLAPTQVTRPRQLNREIGRGRAEFIARKLGLRRSRTLTEDQFLEITTGQGEMGDADSAKILDESVRILTNTINRPLACRVEYGGPSPTVLASYGLFVDQYCYLESPANSMAPTRVANVLLTPEFLCPYVGSPPGCGYIGRWMRANGAETTLLQLYESAYPSLALYGFISQQRSGTAQLVTNTKAGVSTQVGMSMAPTIWLVNFALIYTLRPELAAHMPAYWSPIPAPVAAAIEESDDGRVPYSDYASFFE